MGPAFFVESHSFSVMPAKADIKYSQRPSKYSRRSASCLRAFFQYELRQSFNGQLRVEYDVFAAWLSDHEGASANVTKGIEHDIIDVIVTDTKVIA
ncbi:MAG: hypothetical protein DI540_08860 [Sphingobium sp.]|uniref:hypothetical protein n=1 Tax=Sphingobium yanoikuyae TaxID=13690 RepID=UPI000DB8C5DF|nr:MAG: hypothetical protein DI540_08860 [Sphingobium sp.]